MILDSSFLIDVLRRDRAALARGKSLEAQGETLWVPTPAIYELWAGVERADRPDEESRRIEALLRSYTVLDLTQEAAMIAGKISGSLNRRGTVLKAVDVLIGAMALEQGEALLTRNGRDFQRIPGLTVVQY